jgi:hypothetical protein
LSCGIEEAERVRLVTDPYSVSSVAFCAPRCTKNAGSVGTERRGGSHNGDGVVVEDGGDIFRGELVRGVTNEQTCLADGTVTDDDAPAGRRG